MAQHRLKTLLAGGVAGFLAAATVVMIAAYHWSAEPMSAAPNSDLRPTSSPIMASPQQSPTTDAGDYVAITGTAQRLYHPTAPGSVEYCPLDELGRAQCAFGELTSSQRQAAEARGRQELTIDPPGWGHNQIVTIPAARAAEGSQPYRGWFWNRSHLVGDSLGGAASAPNLITGTRTQNVGSTKSDGMYAGGMAAAEVIARRYLTSNDGDVCPLYYAATARYIGDELIPRTVIVDLASCDGRIDQRMEVSNTAEGWTIDYTTGQITPTR